MGRNRDLPGWLAAVDDRRGVPARAQLAVGLAVAVLVAAADLRGVIGFSSFGVLLYYAVANASAWTQTGVDRRFPRGLQVLGVAGCLLLVVTLPWTSVVVGILVLLVGLAGRFLARRSFGVGDRVP
jgi:APA family basic amino acid/polyamine antiporter